jgi:FkbM family methyltransferase
MSQEWNIDYSFEVVITARRQILRLARGAGLEPQLRTVQRAIGPRETRRTMRDDQALRLVLALTLRADANCVDVGANAGSLLQHMVRYAPHGRHVAFEPLPDRAAQLRHAFPQVDVRQAALASASGTRRFTRVLAADTRSGFDVAGYDAEQVEQLEVEVCALDDALPSDYVPSLIKLDVEGAELEALRGGVRLLTQHRPTVVFEHDARGDTGGVFDFLVRNVGLRIFDMDGDGPLSEGAFRAKVARNTHWNFIAHR